MAEWGITQPIDYSPAGDDIDSFSQKVKHTFEQIYLCLQELRAAAGTIKFSCGLDADKPATDNKTNDIYLATDSSAFYIWTDNSWKNFLSQGNNVSISTSDSGVNHLKRLVGELQLALTIAELDTTGYDSMATEVFFGDSTKIDTTTATITQILRGSNEITVTSFKGLIIGGNYLLTDGNYKQDVKISAMKIENGKNLITLSQNVSYHFSSTNTVLKRSTGLISEGYITGDGVTFITLPINFVNKVTGEGKKISTAHLNVKHQNINGAEIKAEIALIPNPQFVHDEVLGIGNGTTQEITLANTDNLSSWGFKIYFNGVEQTNGYTFSPSNGKVSFNAASDVIVTADYYYNWTAEEFTAMNKSGVYCDNKNNARATTQFVYTSTNSGNVAILRLTLNQIGGIENELALGIATGSAQGFKLPHHAIENSIQVFPFTATWSWHDDLDILVVTAQQGQNISVSYNYKAKPFNIDSFAVMFNE